MRRFSITTFVVVLVTLITPLLIVSSIDYSVEIDEVSIDPIDPYQIASVIQIDGESGWIDGGYPGSGTQEDPYVVEDLHLGSDSTCLSIYDTESYFVVRNCSFTVTIMHQDWGLYGISGVIFHNVINGKIENCEVQSNACGIFLSDSRDCTVQNNLVTADVADVVLDESTTCTVENNVLNGRGIYIDEPYYRQHDSSFWNHDLQGNTLRGVQIGSHVGLEDSVLDGDSYSQVFLRDSRNVTVVGGNFTSVRLALAIIGSIDCSIVNVTTDVTRTEVVMLGCHNCSIIGGKLEREYSNNILVKECTECSIFNTDGGTTSITIRETNGIQICMSVLEDVTSYKSNDCIIDAVNITNLYLENVEEVVLRQSHLERVSLWDVRTCLIINNTILSPFVGNSIYSYYCNHLSVIANRINSGVRIRRSSEVTFSGNLIISEYMVEVNFSYFCNNVTVHNNQLVNSSFEIDLFDQEWTFDFSNNTVNSKPVLYIQNQENVTITGDAYGQLFVIDSQNIEVIDSSFSDAFAGVMIRDSDGCSFDNVTFQNCYEFQLIIQAALQISVSNSDFIGESKYAILMEDVSGCNVSDSTIGQRVSVDRSNSIKFTDCNMIFQGSVYGRGLTFRYVNSSQIVSCNITDADPLVEIVWSDDIHMHNNQLDAGVAGTARCKLSYSVNLSLSGNDFGNSRFTLYGDLPEHWFHNITDNWKDGKPLAYMMHESNEHIDLDQYGHLVLVSCRNILVSSDGIRETTGLHVAYSEDIQIKMNVKLLPECPIIVFRSKNVSFQDCRFYDEGIQFLHSQHLNIIRCELIVADYLDFSSCSNIVMEECLIENARMYLSRVSRVSIKGCIFRFDSMVDTWVASDIMISECDFSSGNRGVRLRYCSNVRLKSLSITDLSWDAVAISSSETINVHGCRIYNSKTGLNLYQISGGFFTGNWIFNCRDEGIVVYSCDNLCFWNNALAGNDDNAWEYKSANCTWDNGNGWGNYWDDATEGSPYVIDEDSTSVDRYPRLLPRPDFGDPEITNPSDVTVWETEVEDTTIVWRAMDENPLDYWIEINGVFFESGEVHDREIEFNLPYLSIGDYTVTIMVIDPLGHSASDVVIVQVTEVPLSYLISVMSFSGYVSFLTTMVIGLSAFIISDMTRGLTLRLTLLLKKYYNKYWQKEE